MTKGERKSGDLFAMMFLNKYDGPPSWMDWLLLRQDVLYHARKSHSRAFILYERMRKMMLVAWLVKKRLEDPSDSNIPFQSREYHLYGNARWRQKMMRRYFWKEAA